MNEKRGESLLVLVSGPAGSGKTTLSEKLCRSLRLPCVDYDSICEPFLAVLQEKDGVSIRDSAFTRHYRDVCYAAFFDVIFENIALGIDVLATAPLSSESADPGFFPRIKELYGVDFYSIDAHIDIAEDDLWSNIKARGSARDREKLNNWADFMRHSKTRKRHWNADSSVMVRSRGGDFDEGDCLLLMETIREHL
jgi:hypothetical protein